MELQQSVRVTFLLETQSTYLDILSPNSLDNNAAACCRLNELRVEMGFVLKESCSVSGSFVRKTVWTWVFYFLCVEKYQQPAQYPTAFRVVGWNEALCRSSSNVASGVSQSRDSKLQWGNNKLKCWNIIVGTCCSIKSCKCAWVPFLSETSDSAVWAHQTAPHRFNNQRQVKCWLGSL